MDNKKILIVDDDADVALGLRVLFRAHHYVTVVAGDAVSAISQARNEKPDLIVLDLGLPGGDGYLVMERLGNIDELASIPVVVFSARDAATHRDLSLEAGAKAFFQKPVDHAKLLASVEQILAGPSFLRAADVRGAEPPSPAPAQSNDSLFKPFLPTPKPPEESSE